MNRTTLWVIAVGLISGATTVLSMARDRAEQPPPGFSRTNVGVPFRRPSLLGELTVEPRGWSLDHNRAWIGTTPVESLSLTVSLPKWGRLSIHPAIDPRTVPTLHGRGFLAQRLLPDAPALVIHRAGAQGGASGFIDTEGIESPLRCEGALPAPTDDPYLVNIRRTPTGFVASSGGGSLTCHARMSQGVPAIRSGLQRVNVQGLVLDGAATPVPLRAWQWLVGLVLGTLLSVGCARAEAAAGLSRRWIGLGFVPVLLGPLLLGLDVGTAAEDVRLMAANPQLIPAQVSLGLAALCKLLIHVIRLLRTTTGPNGVPPPGWRWVGMAVAIGVIGISMGSGAGPGVAVAIAVAAGLLWAMGHLSDADGPSRLHATTSLLALAAIAALVSFLAGAHSPWMTAAFSAAALAVGVVLWANLNLQHVRWPNPISILAMVLALGWTEYGVGFTLLGQAWVPSEDVVHPEVLTFAMLDRGDFSDRMVAAMPPKRAPIRVVVFGSSTTAGAYGQEDLSTYYPDRLDTLLGPDVEVINQGIAGWTTFHMRHHLDRVADRLNADIWLLYVGFNDWQASGVGIGMSYAEAHERWQSDDVVQETRSWLGNFRLYQGLRFTLLGTMAMESSQPVPPAHMRDNLAHIAQLAKNEGARLWMLTEAVWPPDGRLDAHAEAMQAVAADTPQAHYLNVAEELERHGDPMFLDECHLSANGHQVLAENIAAALRSTPPLRDRDNRR